MTISEEVLIDGRGDHSSVSGTLTAKVDGQDSNPLIRAVGQSVLDSFVLPGKTDPTVLARQVAEGMRAGVRSAIGSCVLVFQGFQVFEEDSNLLEQFRTALVGENVVPRRSARLGIEKSDLSMLRKIGEFAFLLLDDKIFKYMGPGRSVLYHAALLYGKLSGDHHDRLARMVELFEPEGHVTREFLIDQIKRVERARQSDMVQAADPWASAINDRDFDCVLATLSDRRNRRRLVEDYAGRLPRFLRIHERVARRAVGIVFARIADLPVIENRLLPGWGFEAVSRVLLVRNPLDADVTNDEIVVLAERGARGDDHPVDFQWLPHDEDVDAVALASRLAPGAERRLHLFASEECIGWTTVIGEANWSTTDE